MFFNGSMLNVKILSVIKLDWNSRNAYIPSKNSYALSLRIVGDSVFTVKGQSIKANNNDILYFPKSIDYHLLSGKESLYAINFEALDKETVNALEKEIRKYSIKDHNYICELFERITTVWAKKDSFYYVESMSLFYKIISEIEKRFDKKEKNPSFLKIKSALDYINTSFISPDISVSNLADLVGYSEAYFRRIFIKIIGKKPLEYINELRINLARELLLSDYYTIEMISEKCGFTDTKYFSTFFKKQTGYSPSEYRKKL